MTRRRPIRSALLAALPVLLLAGAATAQDRGPGFLDNLFSRGEGQNAPAQRGRGEAVAQPADPSDPAELTVRLDRLENALRQLTGTIEQLQYRNQQLEQQVRGLQQMGGGAAMPPAAATPALPPRAAPPAGQIPPANSGRRSDVFDPSQQPGAPGAPRALGSLSSNGATVAQNEPPIGAPGGRDAGAPLDLSTLSGNQPVQPSIVAAEPSVPGAAMASAPVAAPNNAQPPRAATPNPPAAGKLATLAPSSSPQDEYDLAYGYILHKDYAQAEQAFRDFLKKHPNERLLPDAQYWLGESFYQRQRYRDAAESFLAVSTKYERAGKAPDSLLRLGQSLAAMNQKEAACATLSEVGRKYPKASSGVKRGVEQEIKRAKC
ncbi:MAG: tol-pal system protein YbgF [Pseudolabrys sp.]|nr:tol-pal system protein YbgF [Pseudolabrys sp.]MDP2298259.1 tol-pal system protein YbgF [Pseudolabrys sp.]